MNWSLVVILRKVDVFIEMNLEKNVMYTLISKVYIGGPNKQKHCSINDKCPSLDVTNWNFFTEHINS